MTREFVLPWPPSINHYYRHVGLKVLISKDGRLYRERIVNMLKSKDIPAFTGPVELTVELHPPDNRRRDVDNCLKCLLDSFTHAGLYLDDSQIQKLTVSKKTPLPPVGNAHVRIEDA